ncbi:MAG: transcription-repair coupling factor, partial [Aeromicrobium sp.]
QVFFIHNRVQSIDRAVAALKELVPEARIAAAHGQMGEARLEEVMVQFWEGNFDVLVCTTIVESGLDVSNANTMIIERADTLGLSQLHQLRGRVGRSRERAYAYFLYPPDKPLSETAHDRLQTIASHSELGGGMAVAMKDLEIRGAGNLLGGEQSGHIADVGFDLYIRLVGEAVAEFRGEDGPEPEVRMELPIEAHLPHDYVSSERLRLEMYKHLAQVRTSEDVDQIVAELKDRYGPLPEPVELLIEVALLRIKVRASGLREVTAAGSNMHFSPVVLPESGKVRMARIHPKSLYKEAAGVLQIPQPKEPGFGGKPLRGRALLAWVSDTIDTING